MSAVAASGVRRIADAHLQIRERVALEEDLAWRWRLHLDVYFTPRGTGRVVVPFYKCKGRLQIGQHPSIDSLQHIDVNERGASYFLGFDWHLVR